MEKICSHCKRLLDVSNFKKDKSCKDGYRNTCKDCIRAKKTALQTEKTEEKELHNNSFSRNNTAALQAKNDTLVHSEVAGNNSLKIFSNDDINVLKEMIAAYRKRETKNIINIIQIDIPDAEYVTRSSRVNKKVWSEWLLFVRKNKRYKAQELFSQALKNFMQEFE